MSEAFEPLLRSYDERRRSELVAAYMAVEHAAEPVPEARFAGLREPASRRTVEAMLNLSGRTLIRADRTSWTSGYRDEVAAELARDPACVPPAGDRAVLALVLIHSVAIPRAAGRLPDDTWLSPHPTPLEELRRRSQLPIGELESALRRLRLAGLVTQVRADGRTDGADAGGFVPGPQFHRLTPAARRRLQEELILAAGPDSPLAATIRARRRSRERAEQEAAARRETSAERAGVEQGDVSTQDVREEGL
ncbi:hypothetical protein [Actinomadura rupiterrae]|uniref:DprA-like winged helix domain-containing protein n=1 Tax=Actinomadura rupiterrae TaxID=559627 RepID=UPI0020A2C718|nr:hypothetical protein [Actinomadura rupiterrae]MCP2336286.1 hypothetical protein [Actinomadura rupiterrae]